MVYADDTTLILKDKNFDSLYTNLISEINNVKLWIQSNKLKLNISKTNYILFQNRSVNNSISPISLDGETIKQVSHTKFLGVTICENLSWKYHFDNTSLKLYKITGILYRVLHNLSKEAMNSIYNVIHTLYIVSLYGHAHGRLS